MTFDEKIARLGEMNRKAQAYLAAGSDPKSDEATPMWIEYLEALHEVGKELGYEILKPIESKVEENA